MVSLPEFLDSSPVAAHAATSLSGELDGAGFSRLDERHSWKLEAGKGYYVVRDGKSLMAFIPGAKNPWETGLRIAASHLDSPAWKVKREAISWDKGIWRIPVEAYGGPIHRTWLDRELEAAGMVSFVDHSGQLQSSPWRSNRAVALIPSLAIHLDKEVNKGNELNPQTQMAALMPAAPTTPSLVPTSASTENVPGIPPVDPLTAMIAASLEIDTASIISADIYLVGAQKAELLGEGDEQLIVSGRLDNLAMAHAILASLPPLADATADGRAAVAVDKPGIIAAWFDAEEIGSKTSAGAASLFLDEIVERLVLASGGGREELLRTRRSSFLVSADMAHARHPNFSDKHDSAYAPLMGGGPVVKSHGLQHYATDAASEARVVIAAHNAGINLQKFIIRSDIPCGFSLGPSASTATGIHTVDLGNPLWAMHSIRETASPVDHEKMVSLLKALWI